MSDNKGLQKAAKARKDCFYTDLDVVEDELKFYRKQFRDKVVLCNCDDPYESNFFKYFVLHFNQLKLKKLICTCYSDSPIMGEQISLFDVNKGDNSTPYKAEVTKVYDITGDGAISMDDIKELFLQGENTLSRLEGNGDFRSDECIEILKEADIVVTNPPFSLFREYVAQLIEYNKKFLIIGNVNAITYKEFFPLLRDNKVWIGASIHSGDRKFFVPDDYPLNAAGCGVDDNGRKYIRVKGVRWYTNLDLKARHEEMILFRKYDPETYLKYDNYDAINVDVTADIPCDYDGAIGVPITFLDKYCPEQFELVGADFELAKPILDCIPNDSVYEKGGPAFYLDDGITTDGKERHRRLYKRLVIRNRHPQTPGGEE